MTGNLWHMIGSVKRLVASNGKYILGKLLLLTTSCLTDVQLPSIMDSMASDPPSLGTRIRRARERARLSQEELATAVGASVRAVGDWENNRRKPRNRLGALEEVLGVSLDEPAPAPRLPPRILDAIRREYPDQQEEAIAALEEALGLTSPAAAAEEAPSSRPRRAG